MATMKEKIAKIMDYTGVFVEKVLALDAYQFDAAYACAVNIEENLKVLKSFGLELEGVEEDCGCGGCEIALAECMEEDELPYVTSEELLGFIKSVCALLEEERGGDEMQ